MIMWRSFFLAIGLYVALFGVQCLGVQKFILKTREQVVAKEGGPLGGPPKPQLGPNKEFVPPPWAPWSLMSTGAVVCLYSFTIPKRIHSK
jgi:hypothetical protein